MQNSTKEWFQYVSAVGMLAAGVALTFISFFTRGDVTERVLYFMAQCILYAGGIFGVTIYVKSTVDKAIGKLREESKGKGDKP